MVRSRGCVLHLILSQELLELMTHKSRAIIRDNGLGQAKSCEERSQNLNNSRRRSRQCACSLDPLGVSIYPDENVLPFKWPRKIQVKSCPGSTRPPPRIEWCNRWCRLHFLTLVTQSDRLLDVCRDTWPPHIHS